MTQYEQAYQEFTKLPYVDFDQLDGTIENLVYRAEHDLVLQDEGEWGYMMYGDYNRKIPKRDEKKLRDFVAKWKGK